MNTLWQALLGFAVQSDSVGHVSQEDPRCRCPSGEIDGIVYEHVGVMDFLPSQGIHDERVDALEIGQLAVGYRLHVGDVGQLADAECQYWHLAVHHADGHDVDVAYADGLMRLDGVKAQQWHARIKIRGETIGHRGLQCSGCGLVGIDVDVAKHAKRAQIVDAGHVVVVDMGEQYAVERVEGEGHELHANVGTGIDEQACGVALDEHSTAPTLVARVSTPAYLTPATQ